MSVNPWIAFVSGFVIGVVFEYFYLLVYLYIKCAKEVQGVLRDIKKHS